MVPYRPRGLLQTIMLGRHNAVRIHGSQVESGWLLAKKKQMFSLSARA
jgi:hypothetical protein